MTGKRQVLELDPVHIDRFWAKVQKTDGCWLWRGAIDDDGYGWTRIGTWRTQASRAAYILSGNTLAPRKPLRWTCGTRSCVRPDHLVPAARGEKRPWITGAKNPQWRGGLGFYYARDTAFAAHGATCQRCGATGALDVHHKDRNRRNNAPDNLEPLCRTCHNRENVAVRMARRTHCKRGHELTEQTTTLRRKDGERMARICLECERANQRTWKRAHYQSRKGAKA